MLLGGACCVLLASSLLHADGIVYVAAADLWQCHISPSFQHASCLQTSSTGFFPARHPLCHLYLRASSGRCMPTRSRPSGSVHPPPGGAAAAGAAVAVAVPAASGSPRELPRGAASSAASAAAAQLQEAVRAARPAVSCGSGPTGAAGMQGRESSAGGVHGAKALLTLLLLSDAIERPFSRRSAMCQSALPCGSISHVEELTASAGWRPRQRTVSGLRACALVTQQ